VLGLGNDGEMTRILAVSGDLGDVRLTRTQRVLRVE
jgi:hypothetical protein